MAKPGRNSRQGQLRIVAGIWRSRRLRIASVEGLRPTGERVRETLFNWLHNDLPGARCLDLCAGTGALGLEALSRGAAATDFIEKSPLAVNVLRQNIDSLQANSARVLQDDATRILEQQAARPYDIVFVDPPFAAELHGKLCRLLQAGGYVVPGSLIYLEFEKDQPVPDLPDNWQTQKDKTAGNVRFLLANVLGGKQ